MDRNQEPQGSLNTSKCPSFKYILHWTEICSIYCAIDLRVHGSFSLLKNYAQTWGKTKVAWFCFPIREIPTYLSNDRDTDLTSTAIK